MIDRKDGSNKNCFWFHRVINNIQEKEKVISKLAETTEEEIKKKEAMMKMYKRYIGKFE